MRLISSVFIILLTLLTVLIANDSGSHYVVRIGTSYGGTPMTWESDLIEEGGTAIYYWEVADDSADEDSHPYAGSYASGSRTVFYPASGSGSKRAESGCASASATAKDSNNNARLRGVLYLH